MPLRAPDIADGRPRLHPPEGDNLRHLILAILLHGVADHLLPLVVREVQVKVGHVDAAGIQEALED